MEFKLNVLYLYVLVSCISCVLIYKAATATISGCNSRWCLGPAV